MGLLLVYFKVMLECPIVSYKVIMLSVMSSVILDINKILTRTMSDVLSFNLQLNHRYIML